MLNKCPETRGTNQRINSFSGVITVLCCYLQIHWALFITMLLDYTVRFILLGKGAGS